MTPIDPLGTLLATTAMAALLLHAAGAKMADATAWRQHLAAYGVPGALQPLLAWVLPGLEAGLALGLMTAWRPAAAIGAAGLLLAYGAAMAWHLARGHRLDCGCGTAPIAVSGWLVLRNAGLAAVAAVGAWPAVPRTLSLADFAVAAAALVLATLLYAACHQVLRHHQATRDRIGGRMA